MEAIKPVTTTPCVWHGVDASPKPEDYLNNSHRSILNQKKCYPEIQKRIRTADVVQCYNPYPTPYPHQFVFYKTINTFPRRMCYVVMFVILKLQKKQHRHSQYLCLSMEDRIASYEIHRLIIYSTKDTRLIGITELYIATLGGDCGRNGCVRDVIKKDR